MATGRTLIKTLTACITVLFVKSLLFFSLFGQNPPDKITGIVLDATTKVAIPGVHVFEISKGRGTTTDATGRFSLPVEVYPARIVFQHLSYFTDTLFIANSKEFKKQFAKNEALLFLRTNVFEIGEVTITANAKKLFEEEPFAIVDYQFLKNKIIAIGYRNYNEFKKEILVADLNGKVLWSKPIRDIRELYQDCLGDVYLVEKDNARQVVVRGDSIAVKSSCRIDFFSDFVRPVDVVLDSATVFSKTSYEKQYKDYYLVRGQNETAEHIYQAGNTRKEQEYSQMNQSSSQEFLSMITRSFIPAAEMRAIYHRIFITELDKMTQYKPVYTELFMVGDSLLLFDFAKFSIIRFSKEGAQTGETPMRFVFNNDWERRMHRDPVTGRYYLEFLNGQLSYLIELDPKTGDEVRKIPVPMYKHIDHIKIINDRIYFLHQPDIGDRGKKLYYFDI